MKRILLLVAMLALAVFLAATLMACGESETTSVESATTSDETTPVTTSSGNPNGIPDYVDGKLFIIEDGKTNYQVIFPIGANKNSVSGSVFSQTLTELRKAFKNYGFQLITIKDDSIPLGQEDTFVVPEYEILLGTTNRAESDISDDDLAFNEAVIRVVGKKVVITGQNNTVAAMATLKFIEKYMPEDGTAVMLPTDLNEKITVDASDCIDTGMTYADMAEDVLNSFDNAYWDGEWIDGGRVWTGAEMLEIYADIYEMTGKEEDRQKLLSFINRYKNVNGYAWQGFGMNDDVMWASIAFSRVTLLTGEEKWGNYAKTNFDLTFKKAWSDELGGGLWWRNEKDSKNSCVNCPGAIAACLIGEITGDNSYFEKAKQIMEWEIKTLFNATSGQVYDSIDTKGTINQYKSTYNQGTFIGACTLLYQHYKDDAYLKYAQKAADFAMKYMTENDILNGEGSLGRVDLPGFKGILVRWLYRYAKEVDSIEILSFLQKNAAVAYQNRNADGLIWTTWGNKTPDSATTNPEYIIWGMSAAVSLMYNCQQWW